MATLKPLYGTATAITITTTALATDTNLLAGRQSNIVNNTTDLAIDAIIGGTVVTPTSTANTSVEIWLFGSWDNGTTFSAGASSAGDGAFSPATQGVKNLMALVAVINQTDTTGRTYTVGPISVAGAFGTMPDHWGVYVVQNTGGTLGATTLKYTPIQYQSV